MSWLDNMCIFPLNFSLVSPVIKHAKSNKEVIDLKALYSDKKQYNFLDWCCKKKFSYPFIPTWHILSSTRISPESGEIESSFKSIIISIRVDALGTQINILWLTRFNTTAIDSFKAPIQSLYYFDVRMQGLREIIVSLHGVIQHKCCIFSQSILKFRNN